MANSGTVMLLGLGTHHASVVEAHAPNGVVRQPTLPISTSRLTRLVRASRPVVVVLPAAAPEFAEAVGGVASLDATIAIMALAGPHEGTTVLAALDSGASTVADPDDGPAVARALRRAIEITATRRTARDATLPDGLAELALRATSDGVWDWNLVTGEVIHSASWCEMLGFDLSEIESSISAFKRLVHPDDLEPTFRKLKEEIEERRQFGRAEFRLRHRDGHWVHVSTRAAVIRNEEGQAIRCVGTNRDMTEQRRQEAALLDRLALRERIASFASTVPGLFYSAQIGPDGAISAPFISGALESLLGIDPQDVAAGFQVFLSRLRAEDVMQIATAATHLPGDGVPIPTEFAYQHPKKGGRWLAGRAVAYRQRGGAVTWTGYIEDVTERKTAEETLQASDERATLALSGARMGLWEWDILTDRVYWSPGCADIVGAPAIAEDLAGLARLTHPDDVPAVRAAIARAVEQEEAVEVGFRVIQEDEALRWVHATMRASRPEGGRPTRVIGLLTDVTARRRAEERLRLHGAALEAAENAIFIANRDGVVEWVNSAFTRLSGYSFDEAVGQHSATIQGTEHHGPELFENLWSTVLSGRTWQGQLVNRRKDGSAYTEHQSITPVPGPDGVIRHFVSVKEDITARLAAENALIDTQHALMAQQEKLEETVQARTAALAASEARTRLILESTADGLYGVDVNGRITFANRAACEMLGTTSEALVGLHVHDALRPRHPDGTLQDSENPALLVAVTGSTPVRQLGDFYTRADGSAFPVSHAVQPLVEDGVTIGAVVSFTDVTAQERAEAARARALQEAERLAQARSDFVANMSHEIRTPLNAVLGLAQIGARTTVARRARDTFVRIVDAGQHLLGVIDDILDFSKIEAGKIVIEHAEVDLGLVIDRAVDLTAARAWAKGLQFLIEESPDLPARINGDTLRLTQVLMNLLSNAVKFTERGHVALSVSRDGDALRFRVEDTGIGMTHEQLSRTARPFHQADTSTTRRFGGTGLGLAITQQLIASMGGTLSVASAPGVGTSFDVRLPLVGAVEAEQPSGQVAIYGLDSGDSARLVSALAARSVRTHIGTARDTAPAKAMILVSAEALQARLMMQLVVAALDRGQNVAVVARAGESAAPYAIRERVVELEEPLRARQVVAALRRERRVVGVVPRSGRLTGYNILAAEDNEINRLVLDELIGAEGARIVCVENGRRAVDRIRADGPESYDLVLADVQMPEMDGYQATRMIHELRPELPVVALTAHATQEERARCLAAGMVEHVAKPFDIDRLVDVIRRFAPRPEVAPPPVEAPEPEPIDWSVLDARFRGRTGFIVQLLSTMLSGHTHTVRELQEAASNADLERIAFLTHTVKGMAGNLTANRLHLLASETESLARALDASAADKAREVADVLAALLEATERRVHELQTPTA